MAEQSGKRAFLKEDRCSRAPFATAETFKEGITASTGSHSTITQGTSNGGEHVCVEMEIRSGAASDSGCCNVILGCRLRTLHPQRGVSYHRKFQPRASRPTLSESADPREIINATTAMAKAAQIAADATQDIVDDVKDTTRVLRIRACMMKDKASRMLRQRDRIHYIFIATDYEQDVFNAETVCGDAQSAYLTAFETVVVARNSVRQLSAAITSGSVETGELEKAATKAFASANRATIVCYQKQYLALQTLRKCKMDLITPVFPKCECERWGFINRLAILLVSIVFVVGWAVFVWALFDSIGIYYYLKLGIGLALIGIAVAYLLYKLRSCWRKVQARQIRNDELERSIEDIDTTVRWLWRDYMGIEVPSIPLNEE